MIWDVTVYLYILDFFEFGKPLYTPDFLSFKKPLYTLGFLGFGISL